jgi:transcriptional regulator with XRE-family HTH domain
MPVMTTSHEVAATIRAELARRRIPQARLAQLLGMTQVSVSRRLTGQTPITVDELVTIAGFLELPISQLLKDDAA